MEDHLCNIFLKPVEVLEELRGLGFTWTRIAEMTGF